MNVTIKLKDLAPDVQEALRRKAVAEGKPIWEIGRDALNQALSKPTKAAKSKAK